MSDNDKKRYYWLKLKKDFFQQHQIKVLKALPNGRLYALIYLELLAESTTHDGELRYSKMLPYDTVTLASVIDEDKDNVEKAIETLVNLEMVEVLDDGTIYMREIQKLIGSETGKAERMRDYREQKKVENATSLPQCSLENRVQSTENRIERDIYKDIERITDLGLLEEAEKLTKLAIENNLDWRTYRTICDSLFNPHIVNKDKYIETILKGNEGNE